MVKDEIYQSHECGKLCVFKVARSKLSDGAWAIYRWEKPVAPARYCPGCGELLEVPNDRGD